MFSGLNNEAELITSHADSWHMIQASFILSATISHKSAKTNLDRNTILCFL